MFWLVYVSSFLVQGFDADVGSWNAVKPFNRSFSLSSPPMEGEDIALMQHLLRRSCDDDLSITGLYDETTARCVRNFKNNQDINTEGDIFDVDTASKLLECCMHDRYEFNLADMRLYESSAKFVIHIQVKRDRDADFNAVLYSTSKGEEKIFEFKARLQGDKGDDGKDLNQLTTNGNTPTGLVFADLNTNMPDEQKYGPCPIIRLVKGVSGNSAMKFKEKTFISNIRSGLMIHTWNDNLPLPNGSGSIIVSPDEMQELVDKLQNDLQIQLNENTFGKEPYPYQTQGFVAIEQVD